MKIYTLRSNIVTLEEMGRKFGMEANGSLETLVNVGNTNIIINSEI